MFDEISATNYTLSPAEIFQVGGSRSTKGGLVRDRRVGGRGWGAGGP